MKMLLPMVVMATLAFLATKNAAISAPNYADVTALPCTIGREPDPASGNRYRWVIPVEDPCQCTRLELGSLNTATPCRPFPVTYYDSFLLSSDPAEIRHWLNCSTGAISNSKYCPSGIKDLGMKDYSIPDEEITSSTNFGSSGCQPHLARLDQDHGAWCADNSAFNTSVVSAEWIQVDFNSKVYIMGVILQGKSWRVYPNEDAWVTEYQVAYSSDGYHWENVINANGTRTTFVGSTDVSSHVQSAFETALHTRYIRILPTACYVICCMRFELLGCY